jgi:O86/O127-antigen biosynthesis beta-1,3-galactosyltransferase
LQLVSILICVNRIDEFFVRSIESLDKQDYKNFEIVLVGNTLSVQDQASLETIASLYPKMRAFLTDIKYLTFSLNLGLHHCQGNLVARMDADDIAYPNRLGKQVAFMEAHPEVDICGTAYDLIDDNDLVIGTCTVPLSDEAIKRTIYWKNPFGHPTVMFKRDIVKSFGGYMGGLHAEDYDLWCRMALDGATKFANLPEKLLGYRATPTGLARKSKLAYAGTSAAQWRSFVLTGDIRWLASASITLGKRFLRAIQ